MAGEARVLRADRSQLSWDLVDLEALLEPGHRARVVWSFVEGLDLSALYASIGSREGEPGRPPPDPKVLMALWLYATLEGVGSARQLDRLVSRDVAYRWLAGGVPVNYHGLADFRVGWGEVLDRLLTESVTALVSEGLASLDEMAVDGTKVRSPAGSGSFTRGGRLERLEREAAERIARLKAQVQADPASSRRRRQAAQARAARETQDKAARARAALEKLRKEKAEREKTHPGREKTKREPSVSLTDQEARRMKFHDGSVRAGFNIQTAMSPATGLVTAVMTTDRRNDLGLGAPMIDEVARRYGTTPKRALFDKGYADQDDVVAMATHPKGPVEVFMPTPTEKPQDQLSPQQLKQRSAKRAQEPPAVQAWRARMQTDAAKQVFARRKRCELTHAHYKNRGLGRLTVTGLIKTQAVALWHALANNLLIAHRLHTQTQLA
jgi:transposase